MLQSMGSQRVRHNLVTEQQQEQNKPKDPLEANENSRLIGKDPDAGKDCRQKEEEDFRG